MKKQTGFTLIETLIFIIVVGIALAGIAMIFATNAQNSAAPLIRERTVSIAKAYLDEIIAKRWDENTPVGGGCIDTDTGSTNDSCTQYCSALTTNQCVRSKCAYDSSTTSCNAANTVSTTFGQDSGETGRSQWDDIDDFSSYPVHSPQDQNGSPISGYSDYLVSINISQPSSNWQGIPASDVRRIDVSVTNPLGETITISTYRVNF